MVGHFTAAAVTKHMFGASQLFNEPQPERPLESISQDSREDPLKQAISKPSYSDSVSHDVSDIKNVNPQMIVSAIPVEQRGKVNLDTCKSPPPALAPYLKNMIKLVPDPKGPGCKTEPPLSQSTIETL